MFARKKPSPQPPIHAATLKKLLDLPPAADLVLAALLGGYGLMAIYIEGARFVGILCLVSAVAFALLGIAATQREMKSYKVIANASSPEALRSLTTAQFEQYLIALFSLQGYQVRSGINEFHRQDDADLIAIRRKQTTIVQYNHWDEEVVEVRALQSLHKAASALRAAEAIAITLGRFSREANDWGRRKGLHLMTMREVLEMAATCTEGTHEQKDDAPAAAGGPTSEPFAATTPTQLLFVDFAGVPQAAQHVIALLEKHPEYRVVASTLPPGKSIPSLAAQMRASGERLIDAMPAASQGRFFAIQRYLLTTPDGHDSPWVALDSEAHHFPEGCTNVVAVNRAFGVDAGVLQRVSVAMASAARTNAVLQKASPANPSRAHARSDD